MKSLFKQALTCGISGLIGLLATKMIYDKKMINLLEEENSKLKAVIQMYEDDMEENLEDIKDINKRFDEILFSVNKGES